jgi:RNA polymerase sigma factor (sigma-70 family)
MRNRQLPSVLRYLRTLVGAEAAGDSIDRELLRRFAAGQEEAAFEALMQRHGPMVLGVCRRVLQDVHAAEDAFQATFFVLVRKAASLDRRGSLAGWLYTVAHHLALKARSAALRRRLREGPIEDLPAAETSADSIWWELRPILDEELSRLPEKYRAPLVLCYLEGKTNADAAQELGCPCGTVSSRLARGRDLLRARLSRRNLALTPTLFAAALTQTPVAVLPATLREAACKAAYLFAAGKTFAEGAAPSAVGLANGMLRATGMTYVRIAAALLLAVSVVGSAAAFLIQHASPEGPAVVAGSASSPGTTAPLQEEIDPECKEHPRLNDGGALIASPEAFATLVKPDCSHCRLEAQRRGGELREEDRVVCWVRGDFDGGVIPLRFFLSTHRVISDKYGVFVHDPDAGYARGFSPSLEFRFHGWRNGIMVMRHQDGTLYSCLSGTAFDGPGKGTRLQPVPTLVSAWGPWLRRYPDILAYRMGPQFQPVDLPTAVHKDSCHSRARPDRRLPIAAPVLGVVEGTHARAYPLDRLAEAGMLRDIVDGRPRLLLWDPATRTAAAYRPVASPPRTDPAPQRPLTIGLAPKGAGAPFIDQETGSHWDIAGRAVAGEMKGWTLSWLDGVQVKWFAWAQEYPQTSIFGQ